MAKRKVRRRKASPSRAARIAAARQVVLVAVKAFYAEKAQRAFLRALELADAVRELVAIESRRRP